MTLTELRHKIAQLNREHAELSARLYVHALADQDTEAVEVYEKLQAMESEIYWLRQRRDDELSSGWLEEQGQAAVEKACELWGIEE